MYKPQTEESIDQGDLFTETFNLFDGSMNAYDGEGNLVAVSAKVDQDNGMLTFRAFGPNVLAVETYTELVSCDPSPSFISKSLI